MKREYGVQVLGKHSQTNNLTGLGLRAPDCFMQNKNLGLSNELIKVELPP